MMGSLFWLIRCNVLGEFRNFRLWLKRNFVECFQWCSLFGLFILSFLHLLLSQLYLWWGFGYLQTVEVWCKWAVYSPSFLMYAMPANSVTWSKFSNCSLVVFFGILELLILFLNFDLASLMTLHAYFGRNLKLRWPLFLHVEHVALETHSGIVGGLLCALFWQLVSVCPSLWQYLHLILFWKVLFLGLFVVLLFVSLEDVNRLIL